MFELKESEARRMEEGEKYSWEDLPAEIHHILLRNLAPKDLARFGLVSKYSYAISAPLWKDYCIRRWIPSGFPTQEAENEFLRPFISARERERKTKEESDAKEVLNFALWKEAFKALSQPIFLWTLTKKGNMSLHARQKAFLREHNITVCTLCFFF